MWFRPSRPLCCSLVLLAMTGILLFRYKTHAHIKTTTRTTDPVGILQPWGGSAKRAIKEKIRKGRVGVGENANR